MFKSTFDIIINNNIFVAKFQNLPDCKQLDF